MRFHAIVSVVLAAILIANIFLVAFRVYDFLVFWIIILIGFVGLLILKKVNTSPLPKTKKKN